MGKHTKPRKITPTICVVCGGLFMAKNSKGMVCSKECRRIRLHSMQHELRCSVCGNEFIGKWRELKTCSIECMKKAIKEAGDGYNASHKKKLPSLCKQCGAAFEYNPGQKRAGLFCSMKCNKEWETAHGRPDRRKQRHCKQCGKALEYGWVSRFCSSQCAHIKREEEKTEAMCRHCKVVFMGYNHAKSCSAIECQRATRRQISSKRRAVKKLATVGIVDFAYIRKRDGDTCQICGKRVRFDKPHPHPKSPSYDHILPLAKGGEHSNINIQLTHLICNIKKKDQIGAGVQMMLF